MTTYVLVHGAWHNARHWQALVDELEHRGHRAVAVDLLGHGNRVSWPPGYPSDPHWFDRPSPVADLALDDVVADLVVQIRELGQRVVLVAHSMGGVVATRTAELAGELLAELVYVTAFVPTSSGPAMAYLQTPEAASALGGGLYRGDPTRTGAVRIDPSCTDVAYRDELAAAYFSGLETDRFEHLCAALTPDQPISFVATDVGATADRWGAVPRTYVRTTLDRALPVELQDRMIAEADALTAPVRSRVVTIEAGHAVFASHPVELADALHA